MAAGDASSHSRLGAPGAVLGGIAILLAAAIFVGGGSSDAAIFPIGAGALALALAAMAATLAGVMPLPRIVTAGAVCLLLLTLLVVWEGITILWSVAPDRSWAYTNRGLAYLAFLVLGIFAGALARRAPTLVAAGLGLFIAGALAWALAGKIAPGLVDDGGRIARLRIPIGHWNGLALLFVLGLPLALWLASERRHARLLRAGAVAFLYALVVGLVLTYSRGGILAGIAAVVVWVALTSERVEGVIALLLAAPFAAGVLVFTFQLSGIVEDGQEFSARAADGKVFGLALGLGLAGTFLAALAVSHLEARRPLTEETRAGARRAVMLGLVGLALAGTIALAARAPATADWIERQADAFANPPTELVTQEASRLTSLSSNNRWSWWNEAWDAFRAEPLTGVGASSFPTVHRLLRSDPLTVTTPHNVPLQLLAETGIVGALLGCGAAVAALAGAFCALRRLSGRERASAAALTAGIVAFVLHSLVDFDWDFVALVAPVLVATGVLFATGRAHASARRSLAYVLVPVALFAAAFVSLGAPWLADRRVDDAYAALGEGRAEVGLRAADRARSLNPLALDPLYAHASAQTLLGDVEGARLTLIEAVELQPFEADAWYALGAFELEVANRPQEARRYLERSRDLDQFGPAPALLAELEAPRFNPR